MHINSEIAVYHEKETGALDHPESQFCLTWLQQHGYMEGNFGDAEGLSKAKDIDISATARQGHHRRARPSSVIAP